MGDERSDPRTYSVSLTREEWHRVLATLLVDGHESWVLTAIAQQLPPEVREDD